MKNLCITFALVATALLSQGCAGPLSAQRGPGYSPYPPNDTYGTEEAYDSETQQLRYEISLLMQHVQSQNQRIRELENKLRGVRFYIDPNGTSIMTIPEEGFRLPGRSPSW